MTNRNAFSPAAIRASRRQANSNNSGKGIIHAPRRVDNPADIIKSQSNHFTPILDLASRWIAEGRQPGRANRIWWSCYAMQNNLPWPPTGRDIKERGK